MKPRQYGVPMKSLHSKNNHFTKSNTEKEDYIGELEELALSLDFEPIVHPLSLANSIQKLSTIPKQELVLNGELSNY